MEDLTSRGTVNEQNLASRRAEEAALRRYQAAHWLDYIAGPLGISSQPSEIEFISCLRNGLILCKAINKVQPGSVSKVIENITPSQSLPWDCQPLPAYQYFENVRNFLVAVGEIKLPVFEASVFERENLVEGSSNKVVDCILELKAYHEWKQMTGGNGNYKPPRSPMFVHSASRNQEQITPVKITHSSSRKLDMSGESDKPMPSESRIRKLEDEIVQALVEQMVDAKENMDSNLFASYRSGNVDSVKFFNKILSSCVAKQFQNTFPEAKSSILDNLRERNRSPVSSGYILLADLSNVDYHKCCRACLQKGICNHWNLVEQQETELLNIKQLLSSAKKEFESLQSQFQNDLKQLGDQVIEMSTAAHGYQEVVKENRNLYNMVQDLKGNIRVYCRIRPIFGAKAQNIIDFIGEDNTLVIVDPLRLQKDGKKLFQFNRIFRPTATQDEVFKDTQPLIRSVMDGYNVCIFAYGQTGSGKTHTMSGPSGGSDKELGISYLALNDLFELSAERKDIVKYEIQVQMVEIYNEQVRDLLAQDSAATRLEIRSCASENSLVLPDAKLCPVKSTIDVIKLMKFGEVNRSFGSTAMNSRSSRSHSILTVHVQGEDVSGSILRSCLHLVDLAGSERVDKSEVSGDGLREAQYINKSLACLGDVITALAQKNSHIPYRNSKLTLLLQNSLGGNAKTLMFAHVSPEADSFGETISTLKFAQRVSTVELGAARANKDSSEVLELKAQVENLRKALAKTEVNTPLTKRPKIAPKTPLEKPTKQVTERTPPRTRRLSIENGSTIPIERSINYENKREIKTPSTKTRSRRLSLEGPRNAQKDINGSFQSVTNKVMPPKSPISSSIKSPVAKNVKVPPPIQVTPRSPTSSILKSPMVKIDTAMKIPSLQVPKTPKAENKSRNEVLRVLPSEYRLPSSEIQTPCTNLAKRSQIKKSLRTIGKLIHGSEKRSQNKSTEPTTPLTSIGNVENAKSPISNAKALRMQSLTSIPLEKSRRSSLEGVSTDSYANENSGAKTPPPQVHASTKLTKRWL